MLFWAPSSLDLAKQLIDKGLSTPSIEDLTAALNSKGYYRLPGYWMTFEQEGRFRKGTDLSHILEVHALDRELSAFLFSAIAPIEIALRSQVASVLARHYGTRALHYPNAFKNQDDFIKLQQALEKETLRAIRVRKPLTLHSINEYGILPIWAEVENTTLGTLSRIFENLAENSVAAEITELFGITRLHLKSWLRYLTQIRNACAHHDRLYNMRQGTVAEIAQRCGISLSTLYKYVNQRKEAVRNQMEYEIVEI